jgi:hypothetical protein
MRGIVPNRPPSRLLEEGVGVHGSDVLFGVAEGSLGNADKLGDLLARGTQLRWPTGLSYFSGIRRNYLSRHRCLLNALAAALCIRRVFPLEVLFKLDHLTLQPNKERPETNSGRSASRSGCMSVRSARISDGWSERPKRPMGRCAD